MPKKLPEDVIKHWPEVFRDIDIHTIPVDYLATIRIEFVEGRIWEIDCTAKKSTGADLNKTIASFFDEYGDEISHVDFRLDTAKVKRDITKRVNGFMKNPKKKRK